MATEFSTVQLPPLINGRRYSHELEDPKSIPTDIRAVVLEALHNYFAAVCLNERTLSEASATTAPARSEASAGTSLTDMTFTFSTSNGAIQPESARKKLSDVQRARKALLRKLKACLEDCRKRKVKCPLWHHALRDLLGPGHSQRDEIVVEWAIKYDGESQTPVATTPVSARVSTFAAGGDIEERDDVVDQANGVFNLPPGTPMPYGSGIHETTASLLEDSEGVSPPSFIREDTIVPTLSAPNIYSTIKEELMFPLGSRENVFEPAHYSCWFPDCVAILPMQDLISHFETHLRFQRLDDPLRMVCPACDTFYTHSTDQCVTCSVQSGELVEKLYGRYFPGTTGHRLQPEGGVHASFPSFWSSGGQGYNWSLYQGFGSYPGNNNFGYNNHYQHGSSGSRGGSFYSDTRLALAHFTRTLLLLPISSLRFFHSLISRPKFITVLAIAAAVSLLLGYTQHNWIVSNLAQLVHSVPIVSPSKLPAIGVIVASVAFGLHRIVVHATRANGIRSVWLPRCALNMFNVACGWRRPGWPDTTGYELGHLMP